MNEKEFWASMKRDKNGCLLWQKGGAGDGYGKAFVSRIERGVSRLSAITLESEATE